MFSEILFYELVYMKCFYKFININNFTLFSLSLYKKLYIYIYIHVIQFKKDFGNVSRKTLYMTLNYFYNLIC